MAISAVAAKFFFAVLGGTSVKYPEPVNLSCDPESWAYGRNTTGTTAQGIIYARITFPARVAIVPLLGWRLPRARRTTFAIL